MVAGNASRYRSASKTPVDEMTRRIVIVGAGVLGAALAYRLQRPQAQVTVIDAGAGGATDASFGWINASFYLNEDHFALRAAGIEAYQRLTRDLSVPVRQSGCLNWEVEGAELDACAARLEALGYPCERVSPDRFRALEPAVGPAPDECLLFPTEAVAEPGALRRALMAGAIAKGARLLSGVRVTGMGDHLETTAGEITADVVVMAAGTGCAPLLATMGLTLPMLHRPAFIVETAPLPPLVHHVLASPHGEIRQRTDGVLVMPASQSHQSDSADALTVTAEEAGEAVVARLRDVLPGQAIEWARVTQAARPVPQDELPVIGHLRDGLYLLSMHSGLTLGAITAELAASEILSGPSNETQARLAPFRPDRFEGLRS